MTLAAVPSGPTDRVFAYSRARASVVAAAAVTAICGLAVIGWSRNSHLAWYLAGITVLSVVLFRRLVVARFRASNWLLRIAGEGVYLQCRSYLNATMAASTPTVAFLRFEEMRSVRCVDESREVEYKDTEHQGVTSTTIERRRWLEIEIAGDSTALAEALAAERRARPRRGALYRHYPVQLPSPTTVRVEWSVVPSIEVFCDAIRHRVPVAPAVAITESYTAFDRLPADEQELRLRCLVDQGQTTTAAYLVRGLYGCDLAQAVAFVERLSQSKTDSGPPVERHHDRPS